MQENWVKDIKNSDPGIRKRAIINMAESRDPDAMKILKYIYENDDNPQIRELAKKAGSHLWKTINAPIGNNPSKEPTNSSQTQPPARQQEKPAAAKNQPAPTNEVNQNPVDSMQSLRDDFMQKSTPHPKQNPQTPTPEELPDLNRAPAPSVGVNSKKIAAANTHINRATAMLVKGDKVEAIRSLQQACKINPELIHDDMAQNLAAELTGQPGPQAIQSIIAIKVSTSSRDNKNKPQSRTSLYLLLGALVVLLIAVVLFFQSGLGKTYATAIYISGLKQYKQNIANYEVYVVPPKGNAPEEGLPVVIGLHGYGGSADQMIGISRDFTNEGILYIAPTFGGYEPYPGNGPIQPLVNILNEVSNQYPINKDNIVLLGFSQGGEFSYRFSTMHPEWIKGVVTAGAPYIGIERLPASRSMPYIFSWGSEDGLQDMVIPIQVDPLIQQGYNVKTHIVDGYGHEMTPYAIQQALAMSQQE